MANQNSAQGDFFLIIADVENGLDESVSREFASAFSLDPEIAGQILKSTPIVFAQNLNKKEVKAISPKLQELSEKGIEFRVTARTPKKTPKINWPVRPQFTAGGSASSNGLAFEWNNNAFICPGCNETFLFRRLGKLNFEQAAVSTPVPTQAVAAAPVQKAAPKKAVAQPVAQAAPVESDVDLSISDDMDGDLMEIVEDDAIEAVGEEDLLEISDDVGVADEVEEIELEDIDLSSEVGDVGAVDLEMEEISLDDETVTDESQPEGVISAPEETALGELEEEAVPVGDRYNVFLSKISDSAKRQKAAGLLSKVKGCSASEAKELATRLVIPLAKGVSKDQAEDVLGQFKKLKVFGRMTKVK